MTRSWLRTRDRLPGRASRVLPALLGHSILHVILLVILLAAAAVPGAFAQSTGTIKGKMIDKDTKGPLPFGNVVVVGTTLGAMTREDGTFVLPNVPVGVYQIKASYLGYEDITVDQVRVEA